MDLCFFGEGGSMHMAASLNIPQVVLFGFTSVKTWAPLSNLATILHDDSDVNNIPLDNIYMALKEKMKKISKPSNAH